MGGEGLRGGKGSSLPVQEGTGTVVSWPERERVAKANRALLDQELLAKRLTFASGPYEAHVQFSNFCNMSCVMCWDGDNPPLERMAADVLEKVATQVAPSLSVITPHNGSEPLVAAWDEVKRLAHDYSIQLALTTNTQFLDQRRFEELKDIVEMIVMSIDSHIPEVFHKIRPGSKPQQVFENLRTTARLCTEHGIECLVQAVFMTENAAAMPETVAYMADAGVPTVNVIQMIDVNGHSGYLDPSLHFSADYLEQIKQRCIKVAEQKRIRLGWDLTGFQWFDFREPKTKIRPRRSKIANDYWDQRMKLRHPGFCKYAYNRLLVERDGWLAPCGLATEGELRLGNLREQDFDEIWNGPAARDLRRAHYTWDHPSLCKTCRYSDRPPAKRTLPFIDAFLERAGRRADEAGELIVGEPAHMTRQSHPPAFIVRSPALDAATYRLVIALGGEANQVEEWDLVPVAREDGAIELRIAEESWSALITNVGYWWALVALPPAAQGSGYLMSPEARCLIRHEPLPRISGSTLRYPDQGHLAATYLGGARQVGWEQKEKLPARPGVTEKPAPVARRRFTHRANGNGGPPPGVETKRLAQRRAAADISAAVRAQLPENAMVAVVSKGDEQLVRLGPVTAWHFPCTQDGLYAGFHPGDDGSAILHLEEVRARGAEFLIFPASAFWWLEHYRQFADHLDRNYAVVAERQPRYLIYDLRTATARSGHRRVSARAAGPAAEPTPAVDYQPAPSEGVLAYSGHHRASVRALYRDGDDTFPKFALRGRGYELTDTAGRTYVDWFGAPVLLGYRHPAVEEAIRTQLSEGPTLSLTHPIEVEVATMLARMIPCAEQVTFGKNGSDVVNAAVRVARAFTGRTVILQHGSHGFHEWCVAASAAVPGIPDELRPLVHSFPFNDLEALEQLFERHRGEVAAVVMEPLRDELPSPGYLAGVRDLTHAHGALLVFDEMVTGFRLANGGAQELLGVTPDLACFGKGLANGMPLSALVGGRRHMELVPRVAYGMTFRGETLSLAAARAVLRTLEQQPVAGRIAEIGALVRHEFSAACLRHAVRARLNGHDARMTFSFDDDAALQSETIATAFRRECAAAGVLIVGGILPSAAHDEEAVRRTAEGFDHALERVARLIAEGRRAVVTAMRAGFGELAPQTTAQGGAPLPAGYLDRVRAGGGKLVMSGWLLTPEGPPDVVEFVSEDGVVRVGGRTERPDLADAYPGVPEASAGGFEVTLPADDFASSEDFRFTIRALREGRAIFYTEAVRHRGRHRPARARPPRFADGRLWL